MSKISQTDARLALDDFFASSKPGVCLFFSSPSRRSARHDGWLFPTPTGELFCRSFEEIPRFFQEVERALAQGLTLAGYLTYEAGAAFEPRLPKPDSGALPLAWFGMFADPIRLPAGSLRACVAAQRRRDPDYWLSPPVPGISYTAYASRLSRIHRWIASGDTYQVNYTFPLHTRLVGNAASLLLDLYHRQPVRHAAWVRGGGRDLLSWSPELFFSRDGRQLTLRPMKGTAGRSGRPAADRRRREALQRCPKNQAENVMITDLMRNDAGRLCVPGSVRVPRLFQVEAYRTLYHMTSTVTGRLRARVSWEEIFRGLFPSGSVTGAPKIRTQQIIHEVEPETRGVYTGAIGMLQPRRRGVFSVPIRTLDVNPGNGDGVFRVGSGIVADSRPETEWRECLAKGAFLTGAARELALIETLRWEPDRGIRDLDLHLRRLGHSAFFFRIPCERSRIRKKLLAWLRRHPSKQPLRVRVLLQHTGEWIFEAGSVPETGGEGVPRIAWSRVQTNRRNVFLRHKTTLRAGYDREWENARRRGLIDVIFCNDAGQVTEGCITNITIRRGGRWLTPPVEDGCLPGIARQKLLDQGVCREQSLRPEDVVGADEIRLCNALRGWFPVRLARGSGHLSA